MKLVFAAAVLAWSTQGAAAEKPPAPFTEIVPLYISVDRPLAMLTIGDAAPLPVIFDTGTDENVIDEPLATKAGLKVVGHSTSVDGATGKAKEVPVAETPDPRLSGVPLDTKTVQLFDYRSGDEVGIFGPYSFGDRYVVIELSLNRVRIMPKNSGFTPPGTGHAYVENLPATQVRIAGKFYDAVLDTGNDSLLALPNALLKSIPLKTPAKIVGKAISAHGEQDVLGGELAGSLDVGPFSVKEPEVSFLSDSVVNVGFNAIRYLTVVLDPAGKRTWVLDPATEKPTWSDFTGRFEPRTIRLEQGKLVHQRDGRPPYVLTYLGGDLFEMETGDRIQFFRKEGRVVRLELITRDNRVSPAERTS